MPSAGTQLLLAHQSAGGTGYEGNLAAQSLHRLSDLDTDGSGPKDLGMSSARTESHIAQTLALLNESTRKRRVEAAQETMSRGGQERKFQRLELVKCGIPCSCSGT